MNGNSHPELVIWADVMYNDDVYQEAYVSEMMVRKQIYLPRRQNQMLKRLAKQRGVSEAEIIRQALEREAEMTAPLSRDSRKALDAMTQFARSLRERPELMKGTPYQFIREEIYTEREDRWEVAAEGS